MHRFLILLLGAVSLFSCKKGSESGQKTIFRFTANGIFYEWSLSYPLDLSPARGGMLYPISVQPPTQPKGYNLQTWNQQYSITLNIFIQTDSLTISEQTTTTTVNTSYIGSSFILNNITYAPLKLDDFTTIKITKIQSGKANGTFSALMHEYTGNSTGGNRMEITNGYFENVAISN